MTGLAEDMENVLRPLRALATHLTVDQGALIDQTCDEVIAVCEEEEREAQQLVDEFNKVQDELEDK